MGGMPSSKLLFYGEQSTEFLASRTAGGVCRHECVQFVHRDAFQDEPIEALGTCPDDGFVASAGAARPRGPAHGFRLRVRHGATGARHGYRDSIGISRGEWIT